MPLEKVGVHLGWGPARLSGEWRPDDTERDAAWELYVELVTRISVVPLPPTHGVLREALTSLYQLFGVTREILRKYGPAVAKPPKLGEYRFGHLAIWMLNGALRPFLSRWHPILMEWEEARPDGTTSVAHERSWERSEELRADLESLRRVLLDYAGVLALVCEAPALIDATNEILDQATGGQ